MVQNIAPRVVNITKVMYNARTYEDLRTIFNSIRRAVVINFANDSSHAYILITCTPDIISSMNLTRSSVRRAVAKRNFDDNFPV